MIKEALGPPHSPKCLPTLGSCSSQYLSVSVPLADSKDEGGEPRETGTFAGKHWQVLVGLRMEDPEC